MKRPPAKLATLILSLTLGSAYLTYFDGAAAADDAKCTIAIKGSSPTAKACAKGGRKEAKAVMKDMVTTANNKQKDVKFGCEKCHQDLDNYELTGNAVADYKKLQAASGIK